MVGYDWRRRCLALIGLVLLFAGGWFGTEWIALRAGRFHDFSTSWDRRIPLLTGWAWGYAAIYILVAATFLFTSSWERLRRAMRGIALQSVLAYPFFLFVPVRMIHRPDAMVYRLSGLNAGLTSFFYALDQPDNLFPSLHLSMAFWAGGILVEEHPRWKWPIRAVFLWIALSVLFIRQHYLADVAGGIALAWITRRLLRPTPSISPVSPD